MDCYAACCKRRGTQEGFAVLLTEGEDDLSRYRKVTTDLGPAVPYGENGDCVYLKEDRCSIYPDRPWRCRQFNCVWHYEVGGPGSPHTRFLQESPKVIQLIQIALGIKE